MTQTYYVDPCGSDANPGSKEMPFKTLAHAQSIVRRHPNLGRRPLRVYLREGTHYLEQTLVFRPEDSGAPDAPVAYAAHPGECAVVSGGAALTLDWAPYRNGIYQAVTPKGVAFDQLFVNGARQRMARYPSADPRISPYGGYAADAISPERVARWRDPAGGYLHAMHIHEWGGYHYRMTGKDADGMLAYEGGWQNNRPMGMHDRYRFVENIFEELDAPGEWFHDAKTQTLYFYPPAGLDLQAAAIEVSRLQNLIEFQGCSDRPVQHVHLSGLIFRHANRTFMQTREPLLRSDWAIHRGGAVLFQGAEDCSLADCVFDQVGGNAVFVSNYNRRVAIRGTHIRGAGASGVCFVGDPDAVRNPLFRYEETQSYDVIDKTPGPRTNNYPADCVVDDCLIHEIGTVEKQAAGVQIAMSRGITVRACSIYDTCRAGINVNEGTFGGHLIEYCDVFDTVLETADHGSFNAWGRDRFWDLKGAPPEALAALARLDGETTVIRNSRWRCDHGWDVDLDDGSSNYAIYNNLFLAGGLKLREGFHRTVYNNIAVNNTLHPHVWYAGSGDAVTRNIWAAAYRPARQNHWGKQIDCNLVLDEADRDAFGEQGCDAHSLAGDPLFVDPVNGDFRVEKDSPAMRLGFENFPMDRFGVQKPELKQIARTPQIPDVGGAPRGSEKAETIAWFGATLKELVGQEFSAFGVGKDDGGLQVVEVADGTPAAKQGLLAGDLIQSVSGAPALDAQAFVSACGIAPESQVLLRIVRSQHNVTLAFEMATQPVATP